MKDGAMKTGVLFRKVTVFILGLFVVALGVSLSVKADLGVSPISCVPYVYSRKIPFTLGQLTILLNALLVVFQVVLLRKKYRLIQLIQLPAVMIFGCFIDLTMKMMNGIHASSYVLQLGLCLLSCVVIGFGVFLEVKSNFTYLPGEGLAAAVVEVFQVEFGYVKVGLDGTLVLFGIASSLLLNHQLQGVREGTIVAAILVGFVVKFFIAKLPMLDVWLSEAPSVKTIIVPVDCSE